MSAGASKAQPSTSTSTAGTAGQQQATAQKPSMLSLEEDDEFEDFPVEDWGTEDTEFPKGSAGPEGAHLWEESWDDDDTNDDFSQQLREELKKVEAAKGSK